jgi:hypothetical protein
MITCGSVPLPATTRRRLYCRALLVDGLVNVAVGDVNVLNNARIGVAAQVAAQVCGLKVGPVAVLASAVDRSGRTTTVCQSPQAVTISQN